MGRSRNTYKNIPRNTDTRLTALGGYTFLFRHSYVAHLLLVELNHSKNRERAYSHGGRSFIAN